MYNAKSLKAEEFINDEEILDCLEYARKNKNKKVIYQPQRFDYHVGGY